MEKKDTVSRQSFFRIPPEMTPGFSRIELKSNREAVVENCGGVLEYSDETVRVKTGKTACLLYTSRCV